MFISAETSQKVIELHDLVTSNYKVGKIVPVVTDLKDNYLFALSAKSKAEYLVTDDKLLLAVGKYKKTTIIDLSKFRELI